METSIKVQYVNKWETRISRSSWQRSLFVLVAVCMFSVTLAKSYSVSTVPQLKKAVQMAGRGDTIVLATGDFLFNSTLYIHKQITFSCLKPPCSFNTSAIPDKNGVYIDAGKTVKFANIIFDGHLVHRTAPSIYISSSSSAKFQFCTFMLSGQFQNESHGGHIVVGDHGVITTLDSVFLGNGATYGNHVAIMKRGLGTFCNTFFVKFDKLGLGDVYLGKASVGESCFNSTAKYTDPVGGVHTQVAPVFYANMTKNAKGIVGRVVDIVSASCPIAECTAAF